VTAVAGANAGTTNNPQINRTGVTLANLTNSFYVGSINSVNTPLPITLISFKAYPKNGEVKLEWSTSSEFDNAFFTIQRSKDIQGWENIQKIGSSGNSSVTEYYTAYDLTPYSGTSYYRLMQTDIDGRETYSPIISINLESKTAEISVYPNPSTDHITISLPAAGNYKIALLNSNGQLMNKPVLITGSSTVLDVDGLKAGIYYIHISHDGKNDTLKILINK
jgi:hypothetical protein